MMHYRDIKPEESIAVPDAIVECLLDAWKPSSDVLFPYDEACSVIRNLMTVEKSEFAKKNIQVLVSDDAIVGVTLSLILSEVQAARQVNVFNILSQVEDKREFMTRLSRYNHSFQPLPKEEGIYLSKFAVAKQFREQGQGGVLMEHFLEHQHSDLPIFLEVHKSNAAAIRLYEKYSFETVTDLENTEYNLMKRTKSDR